MRKKILRLLEKGIELHEELISSFNETLPTSIIKSGNHIVEIELPGKINALLVILNADAKYQKYKPVDSLRQAIDLFKDMEIEQAIDHAIANKGLVGLSSCEDCLITVQDLFDTIRCEIDLIIDTLSVYNSKCKALQFQ